MTKKKEEVVTWSPYGNSFQETKKSYIIILYVESITRDGCEIVPTVWTSDMSDGAATFATRLDAEIFLDDLLDGGTTFNVAGYEIKKIQLVKIVKKRKRKDVKKDTD